MNALKVRSLVGLMPLFAVEVLEAEVLDALPDFKQRMQWFIENRPDLSGQHVTSLQTPDGKVRRLLSLCSRDQGCHGCCGADARRGGVPLALRHPLAVQAHRRTRSSAHPRRDDYRVAYEPGESRDGLFGGNSNWRGPIWFPINYLLVEALRRYGRFYGDSLRVECPTGSGQLADPGWEVADELSRRLSSLFLRDGPVGRPSYGRDRVVPRSGDPHCLDLVLFHEYFHGDTGAGLGARHQTGWTGLVAKLLEQSGPGSWAE